MEEQKRVNSGDRPALIDIRDISRTNMYYRKEIVTGEALVDDNRTGDKTIGYLPYNKDNLDEKPANYNPYYTDFKLWVGTQYEFDQIAKVEVIAIRASSDSSHFGGVLAGSGQGVVWTKES